MLDGQRAMMRGDEDGALKHFRDGAAAGDSMCMYNLCAVLCNPGLRQDMEGGGIVYWHLLKVPPTACLRYRRASLARAFTESHNVISRKSSEGQTNSIFEYCIHYVVFI